MLHYTQAIKAEPRNHLLYSNRSLAFLKIDQHYHALEDAKKVVQLMPDWPKVIWSNLLEYLTLHFLFFDNVEFAIFGKLLMHF